MDRFLEKKEFTGDSLDKKIRDNYDEQIIKI